MVNENIDTMAGGKTKNGGQGLWGEMTVLRDIESPEKKGTVTSRRALPS